MFPSAFGGLLTTKTFHFQGKISPAVTHSTPPSSSQCIVSLSLRGRGGVECSEEIPLLYSKQNSRCWNCKPRQATPGVQSPICDEKESRVKPFISQLHQGPLWEIVQYFLGLWTMVFLLMNLLKYFNTAGLSLASVVALLANTTCSNCGGISILKLAKCLLML